MDFSNKQLFLLFETAAGYLLSKVEEWEQIGQSMDVVTEACLDPTRFSQLVQFKSFMPFKTAESALDNMNAIALGSVTDELRVFLIQNLPKKAKKYFLGVGDPSLAKSLAEEGISVTIDKNISELLRGMRFHLKRVLNKLSSDSDIHKFQVGLGHSYSRSKLKFDSNRQDKPITQSIAIIDRLDKDINLFAMRCREWYSWHFPELAKIITDNLKYAEAVKIIGIRDNFESSDEGRDLLKEVIVDDTIFDEIMSAMLISMGQDITEEDMVHIERFADQLIKLYHQRLHLNDYLKTKLKYVAPNLQSLLGDTLAARLIAHSGTLVNLAKSPASTIQIMGAEKALFRALKTKGNTPKYGLLFQSSFIGRASQNNKGRISRYLANKCSLAARIDNFATVSTDIFGLKMREQIESRLIYLTEGVSPQKNAEVMKEACIEYDSLLVEQKKKEKKKSKRKSIQADDKSDSLDNLNISNKKKKKIK